MVERLFFEDRDKYPQSYHQLSVSACRRELNTIQPRIDSVRSKQFAMGADFGYLVPDEPTVRVLFSNCRVSTLNKTYIIF